VSYQVVTWSSSAFHAPGNWLLVAVVNNDNKTVKLGSGAIVAAASTHAAEHGSGLPKGAILLWSGAGVPAGWALCDGQPGTPDLRGRFVLGAGAGAGLTSRSVNDKGGEEAHKLTLDEMPSHAHTVKDPGHLHNWTGTRQQAGVDDHNNTMEFSKGDAGVSDTLSKNTDSRTTGIAIDAAGGGKTHENMPPYFVLAYIIKL
jgi:microcystin-dependent protein